MVYTDYKSKKYTYDERNFISDWNKYHETKFDKLSPIRQKLVLEGKLKSHPLSNNVSKNLGTIKWDIPIAFGLGIFIGLLLRKK